MPQAFLLQTSRGPLFAMNDLEQIRIDLEEFTSLVDEEHYLNGAGLKDKAEFTRIYNRFGHLFNRDTIDFVREYSKTAEGEDERRVSYLKAFLISDYIENRVKELSDKLLTRESEATVNVDGQTLAFRHAAVVIVNEPDRYKRSSILTTWDTQTTSNCTRTSKDST